MFRAVLALLFLTLTSGARAEDAAPPSAPAQATSPVPTSPAPDMVLLKNGGVLRGTISEYDPNGQLILITITGERRTIAASEIRYAGPSASAPGPSTAVPSDSPSTPAANSAAPAPVAVDTYGPNEARFHFDSVPAGLELHVKTSTAVAYGTGGSAVGATFRSLCVAPCDAHLPAGTHSLAVGPAGSVPKQVDPITIRQGDSLRGKYQSRLPIRVLGGIVLVGATVAGLAMVVGGGDLGPALGIMIGGDVIGLATMFIPDAASVTHR